jgi:DNA-binding SARP family transcriptional activator/pimeloyl-ACP methyl ester carboxylesterase
VSAVEFRILGPLEVARDGRKVELASPKQRAVLAALVLYANHVVSASALVEAVWSGSPPATAAHALQVYVSALRRLLEPDRGADQAPALLLTRTPGYLLRVGPGQLDSDRFENLIAQGRAHLATGSAEIAAGLLRNGLALWRGPALSDLEGFDAADREAARLDELRHGASEDRIEADLARGLHAEVIAELRSMVMEHPFRERSWAQLMLALYRSGRQQHALSTYRELRELLSDELGVEPAPVVQQLHQHILDQRPHLDWPPPSERPRSEPQLEPQPEPRSEPQLEPQPEPRSERPRSRPQLEPRSEPAWQPLDHPDTRYVHHAGANVAYQAFGQGATDLIFLPGYVSHLELRWEEPRLASLYRRLAGCSRLIMIDKRGTGLSDRSGGLPAADQQIADIAAVMDAVHSERAVLFGVSDGGVLSLLFAAAHPERVAGVITYAAFAAYAPEPDSGGGYSHEFRHLLTDMEGRHFVLDQPDLEQLVQVMAPSRADDSGFIRWLGRYVRLSAGPGGTATAFQALKAIDIRRLLPTLERPALVLHRSGDRVVPAATARYLAEHLPNARHVELPGDDHVIWAGDVDAIADEVERFLMVLAPGSDRFAQR